MKGAALSEMAKLANGNMPSTSDRYNSGGKTKSGGEASVGKEAHFFFQVIEVF